MDFIFETMQQETAGDGDFDSFEAQIYLTDDKKPTDDCIVLQQLERLSSDVKLCEPVCLSKRTMNLDKQQQERLLRWVRMIIEEQHSNRYRINKNTINYLSEKIELASLLLKESIIDR